MGMQKGQKAPRTITVGLRAAAWWVLRKNRSMTLTDLMMAVCSGREKNAETNLRGWLNKLAAAGLLKRERIEDGKPTSNGTYRYTLVKDLGPKAPVVRVSDGVVFEPNSGETLSYLVTQDHHQAQHVLGAINVTTNPMTSNINRDGAPQ